MDFLLECIGFPPEQDLDALIDLARARGESDAWRGPSGEHLRLPLGGGLELRIDRDGEARPWTLYPHFRTDGRLRLALETVRTLPDSPCDALVTGWANPPPAGDEGTAATSSAESYALSAILTDARRLPRDILRGHVLAVSLAGFALDVEYLGDGEEARERDGPPRRFADGGWIQPLGGIEDPAGCVELQLRIARLDRLTNPLTQAEVAVVTADVPGRPLALLTSPWLLDAERLPAPRVGAWICGTFLLTGRIAGGLPSATEHLGRAFG